MLPKYRETAKVFEVKEPFALAESITKANPLWGRGGLPQIFVPDPDDLIDRGVLELVEDRPLRNLGARFEDPNWRDAEPSLPH